jgi:hypothetical protein
MKPLALGRLGLTSRRSPQSGALTRPAGIPMEVGIQRLQA